MYGVQFPHSANEIRQERGTKQQINHTTDTGDKDTVRQAVIQTHKLALTTVTEETSRTTL